VFLEELVVAYLGPVTMEDEELGDALTYELVQVHNMFL
jgi:hypothetical protein